MNMILKNLNRALDRVTYVLNQIDIIHFNDGVYVNIIMCFNISYICMLSITKEFKLLLRRTVSPADTCLALLSQKLKKAFMVIFSR